MGRPKKTPLDPKAEAIAKLAALAQDESQDIAVRTAAAEALAQVLRPAPPVPAAGAGMARAFTTVYDSLSNPFADCPGSVTITPEKMLEKPAPASVPARESNAEPWIPFFLEPPPTPEPPRFTVDFAGNPAAPTNGDRFWEEQAKLNAPEFFPRPRMPWDAD